MVHLAGPIQVVEGRGLFPMKVGGVLQILELRNDDIYTLPKLTYTYNPKKMGDLEDDVLVSVGWFLGSMWIFQVVCPWFEKQK